MAEDPAVVADSGERRLVGRMRARLEAGSWPRVHCMLLVGVAAAIGYVIWIAPTLLAEAIVNGAVAGKVYHGLQKHDHEF